MVRNYKRVNRPAHICARGPYRRKRNHLEDLRRWDCRDYIEQAVPDVDELAWADEDDLDAELETVPDGWAEIDPRNPKYTIFKVEVELTPGHIETLRMYRGRWVHNTPRKQKNYFWWWLCPDCQRCCQYLYTGPDRHGITCRLCWGRPYRAQSKSEAQRQRERQEKERALSMSFTRGPYGDWYCSKGAREVCHRPPAPPRGWVPRDLLKLYRRTQNQA